MYYIERSEDTVRYWSQRRLPLPKPTQLPAGYRELQSALKELSPHQDRLLSCRYCSDQRGGDFDVENVLIYNPGPGQLAKGSENGIAFSRVHQAPPVAPDGVTYGHLNEYTFPHGSFPDGSRILESVSFSLSGMDRALVWSAAAHALAGEGAKIEGEFGLHVTIAGPDVRKINPAKRLKSLFDGIITALQSESSPSTEAVARLSHHCTLPPADILRLLGRKPRLSVAAQKRRLVGLTANGFVLNPADHLCTEGTLVAVSGDSLRCTVTIYRTDGGLIEAPAPARRMRHKPGDQSFSAFADWLSEEGYTPSTVRTFLSDARRVQAAYGSLDEEYRKDRLASLKETLRYGATDMAEGRPNPTRLDISAGRSGDIARSIFNNLRAATSALNAFQKFKLSEH